MGRIGKTYPRYIATERQVAVAYRRFAVQKIGAGVVGLLLALGVVGWLFTL